MANFVPRVDDPIDDPDFEPEDDNPLGDWHPRVAINRAAMEHFMMETNAPKKIANLAGPYSREVTDNPPPLPREFLNGPWEEIFPNTQAPTKPAPACHHGHGVNWDGWDLESGNPGTGHSARAFLEWVKKNPRRCNNPDCSFAHTGVVGSDLITQSNPHDYWDPKWTLRTGIGTGLPGYDHAATLAAVQRQMEEEAEAKAAAAATAQAHYRDEDTVMEDTYEGHGHAQNMYDADDEDSADNNKKTNKYPHKSVDANTTIPKPDSGKTTATTTKNKNKGKGLMPPAEIKRSARVRLNFEAYRVPTGSRGGNNNADDLINTTGRLGNSTTMRGNRAGVKRRFSQTGLQSEFERGMDEEEDPFM